MSKLTKEGLFLSEGEATLLGLTSEAVVIMGLPRDGSYMNVTPIMTNLTAVKFQGSDRTEEASVVEYLTNDKNYVAVIRCIGLYEALGLSKAKEYKITSSEIASGPRVSGSDGTVYLPKARLTAVAEPIKHGLFGRKPAETPKGKGTGTAREWNGYLVFKDGHIENKHGKSLGYMKKGVKVLDYKEKGKKKSKAIKNIVIEVFGEGIPDDNYHVN